MNVKELGLKIKEARHIHPIHRNSIFLAKYIGKKKFKNILEIGTGTGIIALYLAKQGSKVTGTDINPDSIKIAKENAKLNDLDVHWIVSDLYDNIDGKYECIIFVPPYFNFGRFSKVAYIFEKIFPTPIEAWIGYLLDRFFLYEKASTPRRKLIKKFLEESPPHLSSDGCIFLMIFKSDVPFLEKIPYITYERINVPFFTAIAIFKIKYNKLSHQYI